MTEPQRSNRITIYNPRWVEILLSIDRKNGHSDSVISLSKKSYTSYSYIYCLVKEMENRGILVQTKTGRRINVNLTEKGKELVKHILQMNQLIGLSSSDNRSYINSRPKYSSR